MPLPLTGPDVPSLVPSPTPAVAPALLDELPPFEQNSRDIQGALTAIANELGRLEAARRDMTRNFFPSTADALLAFFEFELGLPPNDPNSTLDERQSTASAFMRRLKSSGSGAEWEAVITSLIGTNWSYEEHDPADPSSPPAYTIVVRIPFASPAAVPASLTVTPSTSSGTLAAGTYFYAVTATTSYGETKPCTAVSATLAGAGHMTLGWTAQAAPTNGYKVYRGTSSSNLKFLASVTTNAYTDTGGTALGTASPPTLDTSGSLRAATAQKLIRSVTPAHLVLDVGYSSGFIVGVSDVGIDAL